MEFKSKIAGITALCLAFTAGAAVSPKLTRAAGMFGDINGDSHVDAKDASIILSYYSYLSTTDGEPVTLEEYVSNGGKAPATTTPAVTTTAETTTTAATTTTEPVTTTTAPIVDSKYGYYEQLDEEYQKYGRWSHYENYVVADGHILIADNDGSNPLKAGANSRKPCLLVSEDGSSIDLRGLDIFKDYGDYLQLKYAGGYLYNVYWTLDGNDRFAKIDMDGNVVRNVDLGKTICDLAALSGNGDAIITVDNKKEYMILKNGSDELVEMPKLTLEGEHGLSIEPSSIQFNSMFYNNKIYLLAYDPNGNEFMYYLDCNDLSWHKCKTFVTKYNSLYNVKYIIGRYAFLSYDSNYIVYDMETDTIVEGIPFVASGTYYGGNSNIDYVDNKWTEIKLPSDAKNFVKDRETVRVLAEEDFSNATRSAYYMSKTHYLYKDNYGLFVRSFEKGKDEEKTVVLFENQ